MQHPIHPHPTQILTLTRFEHVPHLHHQKPKLNLNGSTHEASLTRTILRSLPIVSRMVHPAGDMSGLTPSLPATHATFTHAANSKHTVPFDAQNASILFTYISHHPQHVCTQIATPKYNDHTHTYPPYPGLDSNLEAFSSHPRHARFATLAFPPIASPNDANQKFLSYYLELPSRKDLLERIKLTCLATV